MTSIINFVAEGQDDLAILALAAIAFGLSGVLISYLAHHTWFRFWPVRSDADTKLADTVQTSLLAFSAFVLALSITSGLANLAKVEEQARQEALEIARLNRELGALGDIAAAGRQALTDYARDVADEEWKTLGKADPHLSPRAQRDIDRLWAEIRTIQRNVSLAPAQVRDALNTGLTRIEQLRADRLAAATNSIPAIFWLIIILFVVAASFMNGRNTLHRFGVPLIAVHMSAIGIVIALIVIVDNPFRGTTSVSPSIIASALKPPQ
jgi:uncharacterized protein DUF4239